jgi:hypothetical protein
VTHRELTPKEKLINAETMRHVLTVRALLMEAISVLADRAREHDKSKFSDPEVAFFAEHTDTLKKLVYGSPEYKAVLALGRPAIDHHQKNNRHHPEFFDAGIIDMNLFDLLEMLIDWKAAGLRHETGNLRKSIEINAKRFNMPEALVQILNNTVPVLEDMASKANVAASYPHVEATNG